MTKTKKSQSEVVTSVLLILISIVAAVAVIIFVIPFVKKQLSETDCFSVMNSVEIKNNPAYTCYYLQGNQNNASNLRVQIHFNENESLKGFSLEIGLGSETKNVEITKETPSTIATMFNGGPIILPGKNEDKTYIIKTINQKPDFIKVHPIILNGKICDSYSSLNKIGYCV